MVISIFLVPTECTNLRFTIYIYKFLSNLSILRSSYIIRSLIQVFFHWKRSKSITVCFIGIVLRTYLHIFMNTGPSVEAPSPPSGPSVAIVGHSDIVWHPSSSVEFRNSTVLDRDVSFAVFHSLYIFSVFSRKVVHYPSFSFSPSLRLYSQCISCARKHFRCQRYRTCFIRSTLVSKRKSRDCFLISQSKLQTLHFQMVSWFSIDYFQGYFYNFARFWRYGICWKNL